MASYTTLSRPDDEPIKPPPPPPPSATPLPTITQQAPQQAPQQAALPSVPEPTQERPQATGSTLPSVPPPSAQQPSAPQGVTSVSGAAAPLPSVPPPSATVPTGWAAGIGTIYDTPENVAEFDSLTAYPQGYDQNAVRQEIAKWGTAPSTPAMTPDLQQWLGTMSRYGTPEQILPFVTQSSLGGYMLNNTALEDAMTANGGRLPAVPEPVTAMADAPYNPTLRTITGVEGGPVATDLGGKTGARGGLNPDFIGGGDATPDPTSPIEEPIGGNQPPSTPGTSLPNVPAPIAPPPLQNVDAPGYNPITLPQGGMTAQQIVAMLNSQGGYNAQRPGSGYTPVGAGEQPDSGQFGFDALQSQVEQYKNDLTRDLDARMASRGTLGSSIEEGELGQIGGRVQTAYQQGLADLAAQERGLSLQERAQQIQQNQFAAGLSEQIAARLQQNDQFAANLKNGNAQFAISAGLQERAMALQAQGMAADQAYQYAALEVQTQITNNAQALQRYGLQSDVAYRYAALLQDSQYRNKVLELQEQGQEFDQALAQAAQLFNYGSYSNGQWTGGYYDRQLNEQREGRITGQQLDTASILANIVANIDPSEWGRVLGMLGMGGGGTNTNSGPGYWLGPR
jgi:hypothetical protein